MRKEWNAKPGAVKFLDPTWYSSHVPFTAPSVLGPGFDQHHCEADQYTQIEYNSRMCIVQQEELKLALNSLPHMVALK